MAGEAGKREAAIGPGLADRARQALSWWRDELAAMVPNALRARGQGRRAAIDCVLLVDGRVAAALTDARARTLPDEAEGLALGEALQARLQTLAELAPQRTVRLSIPRGLCLLRRSRLPARALPHVGALLRNEAEALLPFPPDQILGDWYVETEDTGAGALDIVHVVLARPRIAAVEEALALAGLTPVRLTVGESEGRPLPVDLLSARDPSLWAGLKALSPFAKAAWALALLLLLATPFLAIARQDAALEASVAARAGAPKPTPAALSAGAVADFLDARARRVPAAALLDDLARRLPREAVLTQVHLAGDRLTIGVEGMEMGEVQQALLAGPYLLATPPAPTDAPGFLSFDLRPLGETSEARP